MTFGEAKEDYQMELSDMEGMLLHDINGLPERISACSHKLKGDDLMDIVLSLHYTYLMAKKIMTDKHNSVADPKRRFQRKNHVIKS